MHGLISAVLKSDPAVHVVGEAGNAMEARAAIKELNPDVVTLDIEMPEMNGLEFLEKIMRLWLMPVIMISTLTHRGADASLAALEIGAFDCVGKPIPGDARPFVDLTEKVKVAARSQLSFEQITAGGDAIHYGVHLMELLIQRPAAAGRAARPAGDENLLRCQDDRQLLQCRRAECRFQGRPGGTSIPVPIGMTSRVRWLLAERGLRNSANTGYELFNHVGSLGLTFFMQEVTRVRVLEGAIGRLIQKIDGVAAARVHIVMPDIDNLPPRQALSAAPKASVTALPRSCAM